MKTTVTKQFVVTILLIFLLQAVMLIYIFSSFYRTAADDVKALGESNLKSQATMIENYLKKGSDVLWFAANSVDFMIRDGADSEEILNYLLESTEKMQREFDANFTGIYGYLNGNYIDGSGWTPPADYNPKERAWYTEGLEGKGEMVLSEPYVDAETGQIIVSFAEMLSDGESVISLDIILDGVQQITEEMTMDIGYIFVVDGDGMVIAHTDRSQLGKNYEENAAYKDLVEEVGNHDSGNFEMNIEGRSSTIFTEQIVKDWKAVIVANNSLLYEQIRLRLLIGILLSVFIYIVIVAFCVISIKRIVRAEKKEKESMDELQRMNMNIIRALTSTIDAKDRYTSGHSQRVADYAVRIAKKMGKSEDEQRIIFYAGLLHDVGKIRVPVEVINKPGRLTEEEFDQIRIHPVSGYHILRDIHNDERVGYGAKYHHERYDGKGYPNGLEGEIIPEVARIIAVADAYDAMASNRSYRDLLPQEVVREEIINGKGTQFDPEIADIMLEIMDEDKEYNLRQNDESVYHVLVVDDDPLILTYFEEIVRDMDDIRVAKATTVIETFSVLSEGNIDLLLLDLMMPEIDGFTLYQEIRESYDVPVIIMSGDKSKETLEHLRDLRVDDYLAKPLNKAVTKETIHGILHRNTSQIE